MAAGFPAGVWVGCSRSTPAKTIKLQVSAPKVFSASSLYLAHELGYFQDLGLEVELVELRRSSDAVTLLASGRLDASTSSINPTFLNAAARGAEVRIAAGREMASTTCGHQGAIYGKRATFPRGLEDLRQLKGKRLAMSNDRGFSEFALDAHLASVGLGPADVRMVAVGRNEAVASMLGGRVDAVVGGPVFDKDLSDLSGDIVRSKGLASIIPNYQYSYVLFGKTLLHRDPSIGAKFLVGYLRGARDFLSGKTPSYLEEYARSNRLNLTLLKGACRNTFAPDGAIDLASVGRYVRWAVQKKYCPWNVEVSQLVDTRFLEEAHRLMKSAYNSGAICSAPAVVEG